MIARRFVGTLGVAFAIAGFAYWLFPSVLLAVVVFATGLARVYHELLRPIENLASANRLYLGGERATRVPVRGQDEIAALQASFNALADRLEAAQSDVDRLAATRAEFVSTISHELRSPLTALAGYVKLLLGGDAGPLNESQRDYLKIVDTSCGRLTSLVSDLLDVDKLESGKIQLLRQPVELSAVLAEVLESYQALASQKGLRLESKLPAVLGPIQGDRVRLRQIFVNLVSNALKYTEKGRVVLEGEQGAQAVTVRVRDTGVGLRPEEKSKLFQRFYRSRSSLASGEAGSGLGLYLAGQLIESHGGAVSVESVPGEGSVFSVTLPRSTESQEASSGAEAPDAKDEALRAIPVWILEKSAIEGDHLAGIIARSGVRHLGRPLRAERFDDVEKLPVEGGVHEPPALLIYDPAVQGYEASLPAKLKRKLPAGVPILVTSASVTTAAKFAETASALLTKPVDERELVIALRELLAAREQRVLLVSSSADFRASLRLELERRGVRTEDASSAATGLARLEAGGFGLMLIDEADLRGAGEGIAELRKHAPVAVLLSADSAAHAATEAVTESSGGAGLESESVRRVSHAAAGASFSLDRKVGAAGIADVVYRYLEEGTVQ